MAKSTSPYVAGEFWLDKRNDGRSPKIWQITSLKTSPTGRRRGFRYISTHCSDLDEAKKVILAHLEKVHARERKDDNADAYIVPQLILYWEEHGMKTIGVDSTTLRHFIGFLMQDEIGIDATFADLRPSAWRRFVEWRKATHAYCLTWRGKEYNFRSGGVADGTIRRNIAIITAALNHAVEEERAAHTPKAAKKLTGSLKFGQRERVLKMSELGAMFGYARQDRALYNYFTLLLATGMRPAAAMKMNISEQYKPDYKILDLHPVGAPRTKKRNPIVPVIPQFVALIEGHKGRWVMEEDDTSIDAVRSRFRTMRKLLGFEEDVVAKTLRHTVASMLEWKQCDATQISRLLGHAGDAGSNTSMIYKHYNPQRMASVTAGLMEIWDEVMAAADEWCDKNIVGSGPAGKKIILNKGEVHISDEVDDLTRLTRIESMTPSQHEDWKQRRRDQINSARRARKERARNMQAAR